MDLARFARGAALGAAALLFALPALPPRSGASAATTPPAVPLPLVVPVPLAPVRLDGAFDVSLTTAAGTLEGTLDLALAADGGLAGTLDLGGNAFEVTGAQSFRNGKGKISLAASGPAGTLLWKGVLSGSLFAGSSKGTGTLAPGKEIFTLDASPAEPLLAFLHLDALKAANGALSGTGTAAVGAASDPLSVSGKAASGISVAATGESLQWSAKGKAVAAGGWLVSWKAAGRGCRVAGKGTPLAPVAVDLLAGAAPYAGAYPAVGTVTMPASLGGGTEAGYPGQVLAYFETTVAESDSASAITASGGSILGEVPAAGFYLVSTTPGSEGAVATALSGKTGIRTALPHVAAFPMGTPVTIIDDCAGNHGQEVQQAFRDAGGKGALCVSDSDGSGGVVPGKTIGDLFKAVRDNGDQPTLINISSSGKTDRTWEGFMRALLAAIAAIPEGSRDNLVVAFCAGNENLDLAPLLADIRLDPRLAAVLERNVLIVGASEATFHSANDAPGDPDVVLGTDVSSPDGLSLGTSFATPRVLAILQKLMDLRKVGPRVALLALKKAVAENANHEVVESEVLGAVDDLLTRPVLSVKPTSLAFLADEGGADPPAQAILVRNLGRKGKDLQYRVEGAPDWLEVTDPGKPVDGGGQASLSFLAHSSTLFAGTYSTTVTVIDEFAFPISVAVKVTLVVKAPEVYSGSFATSLGSYTGSSGCTWALSVSGTLHLRPKEGTGGTVSGDGDASGDLGIVVTYSPPYTDCTASPFSVNGTGTVTGTKGAVHILVSNDNNFTLEFLGVWSGNTISGPALWSQEFKEDGVIPVYETGGIQNLVLTLEN